MDFYMFWDEYHYGTDDCDWKEVTAECSDFEFLSGSDCLIEASYSPCETDYFMCSSFKEGGIIEDRSGDFEDIQFWSLMRDEEWWFRADNQQYFEFYEFWQEYHFGHDDHEPVCEWNDFFGQCSDFDMLEGECSISVSYNPCVTDHFECNIMYAAATGMTATVEAESCVEDFLEKDFWMAMREEAFWMDNQQYADFFMFWEEFHMDHDDDHHGDDYHHGGDDYNHDDDRECEDVQIEVECNAFSFGEDDCRIEAEYNRCPEREHFICDMVEYNEYGQMEREDCAADFEDAAFWSMMREEQFWNDNMDQYWDFYGFWEEYHTGSRDDNDHDDYGCRSCMQYDCSADTNIDQCDMNQCFNTCTGEDWCEAEWRHQGERHTGSCDDFWAFFDGPVYPEPDCSEMSFCHAPYDCADEYGFMTECMHSFCYEACDDVESCNVDWTTAEGEQYAHTCAEFEAFLEAMTDMDPTCERNCMETVDCMEESGLEFCQYTECEKVCEGYSHESCIVEFMHNGELHGMDCEEFQDQYADDSTCGWECETYYDCSEDMGMEVCEISTCFEPCEMEGACFVDFTGADG
jgi:hypothetical protein